jgi:hypothetical protein
MPTQYLLAFLLIILGSLPAWAAAGESVPLARDGSAQQTVVLAEQASGSLRRSAATLAEYLRRIAGAEFQVTTGDGSRGIALGLPAHFPALRLEDAWLAPGLFDRERYLLRSHARGLYVVGATELAVEHAVWDLLYRIGYRQFFPGPTWEVVPEVRDLQVAVDAEESPDYHSRRIWYGFGPWDYAEEPYRQWCSRNRTASALGLSTGHAYGGIVSAKRAEIARHPEYLALVGGQRQSSHENAKFCISNPGLRQLVVQYANEYFDKDADADSVSVDPSDGGGWCECEACAQMGSVSDRAVTLANEVAAAVAPRGKLVGMYAYNYHSPPPRVRVHPQVIISVATSFLKGGLTVDEIMAGWSAQGATVGVREYYSVNTWDRDLPGRARGSDLAYLAQTIPGFHAQGARFLSAESSDNWGPNGLGYYVASRILWDVGNAECVAEIVDDFLRCAFGPAREPMAKFYQQLDRSRPHLVYDDQLGRMYRALAEARQRADKPEIQARIDHLILYTRYADLYDRYAQAEGGARQAAFEALIRHAYRMRTTMMIHAKALYRDLAARDKRVTIPAEAQWNVPEGRNPWKSSEPFTREELNRFVDEGSVLRKLVQLDFEPVAFSSDLVPAKPLTLPAEKPGELGAGRGEQTFFVWIDDPQSPLELKITGGLIAHYRDRGNVRVDLWQVGGESETGERETKVAHDASVPPDGTEHAVRLTAQQRGLHKIVVADGNDMTRVAWAPGTPITLRSSLDEPLNLSGRWTLYFYVPPGTKLIGLFGGGAGQVLDPDGKSTFGLAERKLGYYSVRVPPGQDGKLWKIQQASGAVRLLTVPPYLARSPEELLLPRETVGAGG